MIRRALAVTVGVLALIVALPAAGTMAQTPDPQAPVVVYQNIHDGDTIGEPAFVLQLCFSSPANIKDLDKGGDFAFEVTQPDGVGLGHRDVFQPDGYGMGIYPGPSVGDTAGEWTFKYRVTSPDAQHVTTGTVKYTVDPAGQPVPHGTPTVCVSSGGTATASPVQSGAVVPTTTPTPVLSGSPGVGGGSETPNSTLKPGSATPIVTRGPVDEGGGSSPDILKLALITVGITGGAALLALIGFFIRRAVGYEPHKPKDGDGGH